jgi:RPA family protein
MSESEQSGAGQREVAYRIFAAEFDDADYSYSESDEERAPNYVITPTGARANRLFLVGVLTEIEEVSEDVLRARVVDPTGAFVLYAGQYQPDEQAFLEGAEPPTFVAVTGKARTFSPDDSDQVFTSIRPESISEVDAETRDRWTVQAAEQTIDRIRWAATALTLDGPVRDELLARGADEGLAHGVELALSHYGTTAAYLDSVYGMAVDAARVVAGEKGEIEGHTAMPDASGSVTPADLLAKLPDDPVRATVDEGESDGPAATPAAGTEGMDSGAGDDGSEPAATGSTESPDDTGGSETVSEETAEPASAPGSEEPEATTPEVSDDLDGESEEGSAEFEPDEEFGDTEADEGVDDAGGSADDEGLGDFEPDEEFELEAETREEIESEFGTEFKSGTEVEEPGEADIETPDPEEMDAPDDGADGTASAEPSEEPVDEQEAGEASATSGEGASGDPAEAGAAGEPEQSQTDSDEATPDESSGDGALTDPDAVQEAVVELMEELDDGSGAERERLLAEMESRHGTDRETTAEAIQSALMDGKCYEPDDSSLKPI